MPNDAEVRAVLRRHGVAVTSRGKLGDRHYKAYEDIQRGAAAAADNSADSWDGPDDDGDIIEAVVPPAADNNADEDTQPQEQPQERRPRRVRTPGPSIGDRLRGKKTGSSTRKKTRHARVPVDRLISRGWGTAARLVSPVSQATARTLALQSPVAGLILEDAVKGTVVDTVLQPVARAEERAEKVFALAGPPLLVMAIEHAQGLEEPARQLRLAVLVPMLEEALGLWVKIAGDKVETAAARMEANAATQAEISRLLAIIFPQAEVNDTDMAADMAADMAGASM